MVWSEGWLYAALEAAASSMNVGKSQFVSMPA